MRNINKHREKINRQSMLVITFLMIISIGIICIGDLIGTLFAIFFLSIGIYCWKNLFELILSKPKKKILYLSDFNKIKYVFLDKKGNQFIYVNKETKGYEKNKYYYVIKTKCEIIELLEEAPNEFPQPILKEKFLFNMYTPIGNFNDIFLLPILYFIAIICMIVTICLPGIIKIYGILFFMPILYLIGYDIYYKYYRREKLKTINALEIPDELKKKQIKEINNSEEILKLENNSKKVLEIFPYIIVIVVLATFITSLISSIKIDYSLETIIFLSIIGLILTMTIVYISYNLYTIIKPNEIHLTTTTNYEEELKKYEEKENKRKRMKNILFFIPRLIFLIPFNILFIYAGIQLLKENLNENILLIIIIYGMLLGFDYAVIRDFIKSK